MTSWLDSITTPTDANGCVVPLDTKELVHKGETREVYGFFYSIRSKDWFVEFGEYEYIRLGACTLPDSWEKLEQDARKTPSEYFEGRGVVVRSDRRVEAMSRSLVRRAKSLAGVCGEG